MAVKDRCSYKGVCPYGCNLSTGCFVENKKVRAREEVKQRAAGQKLQAAADKKRLEREYATKAELQPFLAEGVTVEYDSKAEGSIVLTKPDGVRFEFTATGDDSTCLIAAQI